MKYLTRKEELLLLAVLQLRESAYLVTIREFLNRHTAKKWSVGNVYVPLDRMQKMGYLEAYIGEPTAIRGGKAIKYYRLTSAGKKALAGIKKVQDVMWKNVSDMALEK